jgi:hypothetical protein
MKILAMLARLSRRSWGVLIGVFLDEQILRG